MKWPDVFKKLPDWAQKAIVFLTAVAAFFIAVRQDPYLYGTIFGLVLWVFMFAMLLLKYKKAYQVGDRKRHKYKYRKRTSASSFILNWDLFGIFTLLILAASAFLIKPVNNFIQIGLGIKSPPEFEPARVNQLMVMVAGFEDKSAGKVSGFDLNGRIYRFLTDTIEEHNLDFLVQNYDHSIASTDEAQQILLQYNATAIIWGSFDAAGGRLQITTQMPSTKLECQASSDFEYPDNNSDEVRLTFTEQLPELSGYVTFFVLGRMQYHLTNYDEAEKFLTQAIESSQSSKHLLPIDALMNRAFTYREKKKDDLAIRDLENLIALDSNYPYSYMLMGRIYEGRGDTQSAIATYDRLIAVAPDFACGYNDRGKVYLDKDEYDLAKQDFMKTIEVSPDYYLGYENLGHLFMNVGEYDAAIENYTKSISLNPEADTAYFNRGIAFISKEMYQEAIVDFRKATEVNQTDGLAYCFLAGALTNVDKFEEAVSMAEKGMALPISDKSQSQTCVIALQAAKDRAPVEFSIHK
jgi:tetratricopeptide (TPR) repeat protein